MSEGIAYLIIVATVSLTIVQIEKRANFRLFKYLPSIVIIYFTAMLLSTIGVWDRVAVKPYYLEAKGIILPIMITLLMLQADIRLLAHLKERMLLAFFSATLSIVAGFAVSYALLKPWLEEGAYKTFAALSGSWMGGTGNMVAIQSALNISEAHMAYTLIMDSIDYAMWIMLLLAAVPYAKYFNRWSGGDFEALEQSVTIREEKPFSLPKFLMAIVGVFIVTEVIKWAAPHFIVSEFFTITTWIVLMATAIGAILAMTPLATVGGLNKSAKAMLYLLVALIASRADFTELTQMPLYILAGFIILFVHAVIMLIVGRLFKLDLFTLAVASLANIGGVASAPILAAAYSKSLVPIAVLMAMIGYIIGTAGGLFVAKMLSLM